MRGGKWVVIYVLGVVLVVSGQRLYAQEEKERVVITEVQWDGEEYMRLHNMGTQAVTLTGWQILRQRREGEAVMVLVEFEEGEMAGGEEWLVSKVVSEEADVVAPALTLHNDGDLLQLVDVEGTVMDEVGQLGPWFAGKNTETGVPMVRIDPLVSGLEAGNWRDEGEVTVTPSPGEGDGGEEGVALNAEAVRAALIISEVLPNPVGADAEGEFIELYNKSEETLDITGWQLDDAEEGSKPYVIVEGVVAGGAYTVWQRAETGLALNNEGDGVRLLRPEGEVVLMMTYGAEAKEGWSWNRQSEEYMVSTQVTLGMANVIATPQPSPSPRAVATIELEEGEEEQGDLSDAIVIRSFLPNPTGADEEAEYIELENTGKETVRLQGWQLDDAEGGSKPYILTEEVVLRPNERRTFLRSETKLALNNGEDKVRLIDPAGEIIAEATYPRAGEGEVFTLGVGGTYAVAETGGLVAGAEEKILTVAQARAAAQDAVITVEGVVVAPPGVLGARVMYIADEDGAGLQVYWSKPFAELSWWERVQVTGVITEAAGETRLRLQEEGPTVVGRGEEVPASKVATGAIGESWEGQLVEVVGAVTRSSGQTLYVDDGSGEVRIVVKSEAGITKPRMRQGVKVMVVGIVSQTQSGYRILPRRQEDFVVGGSVAGVDSKESSSALQTVNTNVVLSDITQHMSLPTIELPSVLPNEQQSWLQNTGRAEKRAATRNTIVLIGLGLAAVQLVGGVRESEPLWKRKV